MNCGHCGNDRDIVEVSRGIVRQHTMPDNPGFEWGHFAVVHRCPRCNGLTFRVVEYGDHLDTFTDTRDVDVLYPRTRDLSGLPREVRIEYDRAQKAKLVDRGFYALALRRVLEAICSYKEAQGGNLYQKLKYLVDTKSLPEQFAELAHYLREIGNLGAHVGDIEILESDVEAATDFIEAILEYLYIAPAKLKRVADELAQRRNPQPDDTQGV